MMDKEQTLEKLGKVYEAGKILFNEGDTCEKVYVINEGHVRISRFVCGEEAELEILGPGDYCGELALLQGGPQPVSATVIDNARIIVVEARQFESLIRNNGELAMRMLKKLAGRFNEAQFRITVLQMRSTLGRTMVQLRAEASNHSDKAKIPDNLAAYLGLDEVELDVILQKLVDKKLITLDEKDKTFTIPDDNEYERFMRYLELNDRYAYFDK
ncbi:MAG: Crp/Fnr family transcriptional regulator [Proteobacteria bacterium]|nr:Crp/Fnr family transcriptional regulator [Pseudomonadota bacterium]